MKHFLLFITLLTGGLSFAQGQGDVTVYSNTGDKFYVILNGVRQNDQPQTNVKVTGLSSPYYSCKIISASNNFQIEKNVIVKSDTLITYQVLEKKGKYKLRFYSETSLGTSTAQSDQTVVAYHATENVNPTATTGTTSNTSTVTTTTTGSTSTVQTTGNTRPTGANTVNEGINMNISINENGMSSNVNVTGTEDVNMNTNMNTTGNTTATTSTNNGGYQETVTTTSTTTNNGNTTTYYEETTVTSSSSSGNVSNGNVIENNGTASGSNGSCYFSDTEADALANQVENEAFADDQSRVANTAAKNKCMTTDQIKKVAAKFSFEDNKLSFLKTAYNNCSDQSNYYKLLESLTYSGDKEELQKYMDSQR